MDDLPFNLDEQESELLMKKIPDNIAATGRQWGFNDTVFRDNLFKYIVKEILHFKDVDEYYESDVFKEYNESGKLLSNSILIGETKRFRIFFSHSFYTKDFNETPEGVGNFELVAPSLDIVKSNAFFELSKLIFKDKLAVKKIEITNIEEI